MWKCQKSHIHVHTGSFVLLFFLNTGSGISEIWEGSGRIIQWQTHKGNKTKKTWERFVLEESVAHSWLLLTFRGIKTEWGGMTNPVHLRRCCSYRPLHGKGVGETGLLEDPWGDSQASTTVCVCTEACQEVWIPARPCHKLGQIIHSFQTPVLGHIRAGTYHCFWNLLLLLILLLLVLLLVLLFAAVAGFLQRKEKA